MARLTVKESTKPSQDFFRGNVTGDIYQRGPQGGYLNLTKGYQIPHTAIGRVDLVPLAVGTIITIEVDK